MSAPNYLGKLTITPPLAVKSFPGFDRKTTPGDVGICLSGGGSRALTAGMGQLRALKYLKTNGRSLLSQVKALSTVSGGSWLGVPFEYLTENVSDDEFLNGYVDNPGSLVPSNGPSVAVTLDQLPRGNIGNICNSILFSPEALAVEASVLRNFWGVPLDMLWQTLMGIHILYPYGLYRPDVRANGQPNSYFTFNQETLDDIVNQNPKLRDQEGHLFADATKSARTPRPYLICNSAVFVDLADGTQLLAPVQSGAFFTGIVGRSDAKVNGKFVGGGGVTSFAFNSCPLEVNGPSSVTVEQLRQWSLTDIVGVSSAYFAEAVDKILTKEELLHKHMQTFGEGVNEKLKKCFSKDCEGPSPIEDLRTNPSSLEALKYDVMGFHPIWKTPQYHYWPVLNAQPDPECPRSRFADGGSLENTGIAGMLAYSDIRSIIAFINSETRLQIAAKGVMNDGKEVPDTRIIVDDQIPPLFGYQPYDECKGYVSFSEGGAKGATVYFSRSKVFDPGQFPLLLQGLWKASGNGSNTTPANFTQPLVTQPNDWFGVTGNREIKVLWVYLNPVVTWNCQLRDGVRSLIKGITDFPNYNTMRTYVTNTEINLLANLTAWCVGDDANNAAFTELFSD